MIEVVCGVIHRQGRFLLAQKARGMYASLWEFPGGKVEPGENPEQSLERELQEELCIRVKALDRLMENVINVEGQEIKLIFLRGSIMHGEVRLTDHQDFDWVTPDEMLEYDLVPGDIPFAEKLRSGSFSAFF